MMQTGHNELIIIIITTSRIHQFITQIIQPALHTKKATGYEFQGLHYATYEHNILDI